VKSPRGILGALALVLLFALSAGAPVGVSAGTVAGASAAGTTARALVGTVAGALVGTTAGASIGTTAGARALVVGIGEQHPAMFAEARFRALGIRYARLSIGWNALENRAEARALARWLGAARADGVRPLISFEHSWSPRRHRQLPSAVQFVRQFRTLHARYPWVTDFAVWNEANYCGQPTCHSPGLVAAYYRQMRAICPSCNVLASELLDVPGMVAWVDRLRRVLGYEPGIWGLHNYIGANRLSTASTKALLNATHGQIWFTETGGVVARHNHSSHDFPESASHAAKVTRFVFNRLVPLSPRIARVYIYQWNAGVHRREPWDSGLIGPHGTPRPAFWVLVRELHSLGQLPFTPAAEALLAKASSSGR
jgi:hypothetical protein